MVAHFRILKFPLINHNPEFFIGYHLTGAFYFGNGWVAGGLLGWLLLVIMDHSRKFPTFSTSKSLGTSLHGMIKTEPLGTPIHPPLGASPIHRDPQWRTQGPGWPRDLDLVLLLAQKFDHFLQIVNPLGQPQKRLSHWRAHEDHEGRQCSFVMNRGASHSGDVYTIVHYRLGCT